MRKITLFIFWFWSISLWSQDSVLVTKKFLFEDGLYETFEDLKNNEPSKTWEDVTATYFLNPKTHTTQVRELILKESSEVLEIDSFFAITIGGNPYIRLKPEESIKKNLFSGLKVRGYLGYFSFETSTVEKVKIQAVNPLNGKPFRTGYVDKINTLLIEKMLLWETGEIVEFNQQNLLKHIGSDKPLYSSVSELRDWEIEEKLFKCLLIFNDRHDVFTVRRAED